jgi:hypothetical protein
MEGKAKGLEQTLKERGFDVDKMKAKCKPACPCTNERCCMAWLLSCQDDFLNQISMLEEFITSAGHLCLFLPKFYCELNPIEMVRAYLFKSPPFIQDCSSFTAVLGLCKVPILRRKKVHLRHCQESGNEGA